MKELFISNLKLNVQNLVGANNEVIVKKILKNNGKELDGMMIVEPGCNITPTIYVNEYFDEYCKGRAVSDIAQEIYDIHESKKNVMSIDEDAFCDYSNIKNRIIYRVINLEKNRKLLSDVPYKIVLDLAVVFYWLVNETEDGTAVALIHNSHLKAWNISEDELYEDAVRNTPILSKPKLATMESVMAGIMNRLDESETDIFGETDEKILHKVESEMYILTNRTGVNGAACMMYDGVLENLAQKLNKDLCILPSSIHEVIILVRDKYSIQDLKEMVRGANEVSVDADEVLSNNVYIYNRVSKQIELK